MALSYDEALQKWAFAQFKYVSEERKPNEGDTFTLESTIIYGGYCETCSYESAGFEITNNRTGQSIKVEKDFSQMNNEISKFGQEEDQ